MKKNFFWISRILSILLILFFLFFLVTGVWIGFGVKDNCRTAQEKYGENCVNSLVLLLDNDDEDFRSRNSAIWALGQLGDEKSLSVLEKYYTGDIPDREPLDQGISQYELKKAINLTGGGFNITAIVWRWLFKIS
jgi:hypothetical protein